jgi:hypothetical protein
LADLHGGGDSKQDFVVNLFGYVSKNWTTTPGYLLEDLNAAADIIRGIGWCGQQVFVIMNLLSKAGISVSRPRDFQLHTYSDVSIGKNG